MCRNLTALDDLTGRSLCLPSPPEPCAPSHNIFSVSLTQFIPSGVTAGPANWLDALRVNASNKRKQQVLGARQPAGAAAAAAGAAGGDAGAAGGAAGAGGPENAAPPAAAQRHQGSTTGFPVIYKFNEGYTNAVKRPVLMRELL